MERTQLLDILLKCPFGKERQLLKKLLKTHKAIIDKSFVSILKQEAVRTENQNNWAKIQYLLGLVFYYHLEDSVENDQKAIAFLNAASTVFSEKNFPVEWATVQNYLGNICRNLAGGKSEANIRKAIANYQNALKIRRQDTYPQEWSSIQYNLGVTYGMIAEVVEEQNKAGYLEQAKSCFENFLSFTEPNSEPDWANTKKAVGALAQESSQGRRLDNLHYALDCYKTALKVAKTTGEIEVVISALDYLGHGYRELSGLENREINLELAYRAYSYALKGYDRHTQPYNWAATQNDLGVVLIERGNISQAVDRFKQALTVFTPKAFPDECTRIARNLGNLAYENRLWQTAITGYGTAIEAVEVSRERTTSDKQRQEFIRESLDVYTKMVEACIASGTEEDLAKALETVERSRSRYLTDLIANRDRDFDRQVDITKTKEEKAIEEHLAEYERLQGEIDNLRSKYDKKIQSSENTIRNPFRNVVSVPKDRLNIPLEDIQKLEKWENEKQQIWLLLRDLDIVLAGQVRVDSQNLIQLQKLIDSPKTAILSFYTASSHTYIFILRQSSVSYHLCPNLSLEELNTWLKQQWFEPYQDTQDSGKKRWIANMEAVLQQLADKLDLDRLVDNYLKDLTELVIVPHQLLHLIPFAALPVTNGGYLSDRFILRVVPSCQVLAFCQSREQTQPPLSYGTVVYSQQGLYFSKIEEKLIAWLYDIADDCRLREEQANKNGYHNLLHQKQVQGLLSSHHAKFDPANPLDSELILADSKLKLIELLTLKWRMKELNEVFLSCCETSFGIPEATDDLLTIATGFLCSGARNVISSLWVVDDASTALLSFFYHQARTKGLNRPSALQQAQQRLRNLSDRDLEVAKENRKQAKENKKQARNTVNYQQCEREYAIYLDILDLIEKVLEKKRSQPLSHPFYWAAFTCQGLA